jgi:hypothetical protein
MIERLLILIFFFTIFMTGSSRAVLEYYLKPRDVVLFRISLAISGASLFALLVCAALFQLEEQYHYQHLSFYFWIVLFVFMLFSLLCGVILVLQRSK